MADGHFERPQRNGVDAWIGQRLAAELERQGRTSRDLMRVAYLPAGNLEAHCRGTARFGAYDLMMVLHLLGKSPAWLFDGMLPPFAL